MMPITTGQAAADFLKYLAEPAARSLALGCLAAIALAAFRVKRVPLRLLVWTTTLYAALAMPFLGAFAPRVTFSVPARAAVVAQNVAQRFGQNFRGEDATMASAKSDFGGEASRQLRQTAPQRDVSYKGDRRDTSRLGASVRDKHERLENAGTVALRNGVTAEARGEVKTITVGGEPPQIASTRREQGKTAEITAIPDFEQEASRQLRQTTPQRDVSYRQGSRDPSKLRASVSYTGDTRNPSTLGAGARYGGLAARVPWVAVGMGIYFAVTVLFLARLIVGMFFSWRLERASEEIHEREAIRLVRMRACMGGLESTPRLAETKMLSVPATMGVLHPVILLPVDWQEWDEAKLDAIVAHEVSHVARRDALTQRLSLIHRAIFWFSPLAWWIDRQITELAEEASDEAALAGGADRTRYAETLLGFFAELEAAPGRIHWEGISMANGCRAERRVERILSWKGSNSMKKWLAVMIVAVAAPLIFVAGSAHPLLAQEDNAPKKAHNIIKPGGPVAPALPAAPKTAGVVAPATPAPAVAGTAVPADMPVPPNPEATPSPASAPTEPGAGAGEFTPGPTPRAPQGGVVAPALPPAPNSALAPAGSRRVYLTTSVAAIAPAAPEAGMASGAPMVAISTAALPVPQQSPDQIHTGAGAGAGTGLGVGIGILHEGDLEEIESELRAAQNELQNATAQSVAVNTEQVRAALRALKDAQAAWGEGDSAQMLAAQHALEKAQRIMERKDASQVGEARSALAEAMRDLHEAGQRQAAATEAQDAREQAQRAQGYAKEAQEDAERAKRSSRSYSFGYGNWDGGRYVIMTGDSNNVTMSGSEEDVEHAQRLRKKMGGGDLIWFERDEKSYVITDPAFIAKAKALFAPEEALGKQQEELGRQQEALGKQQEALGDQMEDVKVKIQDIAPQLEEVRARLKELQATGATQRELGRLQGELGRLQGEVGRFQAQAGVGQREIGQQQGELGRKQGELGRHQGDLGRQQGELARKASRDLRGMFDDAIAKGIAKPE